LQGLAYDDVQVIEVSTTIDRFDFYSNTILQASIEVTYKDASQSKVIRARRV
jgi:hypothetical protein